MKLITLAQVACLLGLPSILLAAKPVVIAHRGASGYLPEHTLESAAYAHALGADYIEQDVVMSRDGTLVVLHDIHLETTTDVAARFPERKRPDGRFYALDFTWSELRSLRVSERFDPKTGLAVFPRRFPAASGAFRLCSLEEQIDLITGLNHTTGRKTGLYVEFKDPAFHQKEGRDIGAVVLEVLGRHGYDDPADRIFVQCFDPVALKRLRTELRTRLPLVQLLGDNAWGESPADYNAMRTPTGLKEIATYAQGIGPHLGQIVAGRTADGKAQLTTLVADAQREGLLVHPYTFRADTLPPGIADIAGLLELFLVQAGIDGFFIDQPDAGVRAVTALPLKTENHHPER
jgi:glycerophosphoryl diester phosphodiesterase